MRIRVGGWVAAAIMAIVLPAVVLAEDYRAYEAVGARLQEIGKGNTALVQVTSIGKSAGGREIWVARLAASGTVEPDRRPALFIGANIEGNRFLASEAALAAIDWLIANAAGEAKELLARNTFYIAPALNPDGMVASFARSSGDDPRNVTPINEDGDLIADEDGPEDLNGDGYITVMRYRDPEGKYIPHPEDARVMKLAEAIKGESGIYAIAAEGIDNDGDGRINEDGPGGVVINRNFPHDFQYFSPGSGPWPASEPETIALLEFFFSHRNIALVFSFGSESNLLNLQRGKQAQAAMPARMKIPARFSRFLGIDPEQEFTLKEIVAMVRNTPFARGMEVTEEQVALMLGQGPAMSINGDDFRYFEEVSKRYKEMIKGAKIDDESRKPKPVLGDGSLLTWAYYHYGVPAFGHDLWAVPAPKEEKKEEGLTVDKLKTMDKEDFLALGEEKIAAFIKAQGMEGRVSATMVINMVQGGQTTPAQMAQMIESRARAQKPADSKGRPEESNLLDWAEKNIPGGGFVEWTAYKHPTLGDVEIGGIKPMIGVNPPYAEAQQLLEPNAKFAVTLAELLPRIEFADVAARPLGNGIYEINAWLRNDGWLPTALRHGVTNRAVTPVVVRIEVPGGSLLTGFPINRVASIEGHGTSQKLSWVVKAAKGTKIALTAESAKSGADAETLVLP